MNKILWSTLVLMLLVSNAFAQVDAKTSLLVQTVQRLLQSAHNSNVQSVSFQIQELIVKNTTKPGEILHYYGDIQELLKDVLKKIDTKTDLALVTIILNDPDLKERIAKRNTDRYSGTPVYLSPELNFAGIDSENRISSSLEYMQFLRAQLGLVGPLWAHNGKVAGVEIGTVLGLQKKSNGLYDLIAIEAPRAYAEAANYRSIAHDLKQEELNVFFKKTTELAKQTKFLRPFNFLPILNVTAGASYAAVYMKGFIPAATAVVAAIALDVVTSPAQLGLWCYSYCKGKQQAQLLSEKVNVGPQDVVLLNYEQMQAMIDSFFHAGQAIAGSSCHRVATP